LGLFLANKGTEKHAQQQQQQKRSNMALEALDPALAALPFPHCMCFAIAAKRIFGKVAHEWQAFVAQRIIEGDIRQDPKAMLVVRPTGGGKSLLRDV
jgi:hypothetical protein